MATVVPVDMLRFFTWEELELEVCGEPKMNVDLLRRHTRLEGCVMGLWSGECVSPTLMPVVLAACVHTDFHGRLPRLLRFGRCFAA